MSAAEKACSGRTWRRATEFTNPPTREKLGRTWAYATRSRLLRLLSTRRIRTVFLSLRLGILTALTPSAAFFARPMAVRLSRRSSIRAKILARLTWHSTLPIHRQFTLCYGPLASRRGKSAAAHLSLLVAVEFSSQRMEERTGIR